MNELRDQRFIALDHHLYDQVSNSWLNQSSKPQPYMKLGVDVLVDDYKHFGFEYLLTHPTKHADIMCMADTGCQSCLASIKAISRLGIKRQELIPVTMKMHAANKVGINILGAAILRFSGKTPNGIRESRQIVYVTDVDNKVFLSREACVSLGIISDQFPKVGEIGKRTTTNATFDAPEHLRNDSGLTADCSCPKRELPPPPPTQLPCPATDGNRETLRQFMLDHYKGSTFNTCEHQPLPMMSGPPLKLMIDPGATPFAYHSPIPVPLDWRADVKAGLDRDVLLGVIEPVPIGEPVTSCHRMVVCAKKDGKPRRTVDFQRLNKHATRETHHTQPPFHQARSVPQHTKKSVFDAWNGYHSVALCKEDRALTTFITPWGRYRYMTAPQGYIASGDGYTRRFEDIASDVPNKTKCIDDTIMWSDSITAAFHQAVEWLQLCGNNGITLNPSKFVFAQDNVEFAGFEITTTSVRPSRKFLESILDFPTPANITDIRSWFGLVNQVAYAFAAAERMLPFRALLKPGTTFTWNDDMQSLFEESKSVIISEIEEGVRIFDASRPTCLATDWSKTGIGFWLFQKHCNCRGNKPFCCRDGWKITLAGSRFTHPAESRYAPVEGEALAVADSLNKARYFVLGCKNLTLAVDHKPLLKIFGDRSLDEISNTRLRNLKVKTLGYRFRVIHITGVKHRAADAISRHPTGEPVKMDLPDDVAPLQDAIVSADLPTLAELRTSFLAGIRCGEVFEDTTELSVQNSFIMKMAATAPTDQYNWHIWIP